MMDDMLKYGCCCINCVHQTPQKSCSVDHFRCESNYKEGKCPVTKCFLFKEKDIPTQVPCSYFADIETSGLCMC
jgi:hypothetical protein